MVHKYTCICSFTEYAFYYEGTVNFDDVSIFVTFAKKEHFIAKKVPLLKAIVSDLC